MFSETRIRMSLMRELPKQTLGLIEIRLRQSRSSIPLLSAVSGFPENTYPHVFVQCSHRAQITCESVGDLWGSQPHPCENLR